MNVFSPFRLRCMRAVPVSGAKTAEPIEMPFGIRLVWVQGTTAVQQIHTERSTFRGCVPTDCDVPTHALRIFTRRQHAADESREG